MELLGLLKFHQLPACYGIVGRGCASNRPADDRRLRRDPGGPSSSNALPMAARATVLRRCASELLNGPKARAALCHPCALQLCRLISNGFLARAGLVNATAPVLRYMAIAMLETQSARYATVLLSSALQGCAFALIGTWPASLAACASKQDSNSCIPCIAPERRPASAAQEGPTVPRLSYRQAAMATAPTRVRHRGRFA